MSNRKVFADLLRVTQPMELDMGLGAMTQTDRQGPAGIVLISDDGRKDAFLDDL